MFKEKGLLFLVFDGKLFSYAGHVTVVWLIFIGKGSEYGLKI